jgi:hypothetical protein
METRTRPSKLEARTKHLKLLKPRPGPMSQNLTITAKVNVKTSPSKAKAIDFNLMAKARTKDFDVKDVART